MAAPFALVAGDFESDQNGLQTVRNPPRFSQPGEVSQPKTDPVGRFAVQNLAGPQKTAIGRSRIPSQRCIGLPQTTRRG